jgi:hypothetical protein
MNTAGVFVHAHVIRSTTHRKDLIDALERLGLKTLEIGKELFLEEKEIVDHPEWNNTVCLMTGYAEKVQRLAEIFPEWRYFLEDIDETVESSQVSMPLPFCQD